MPNNNTPDLPNAATETDWLDDFRRDMHIANNHLLRAAHRVRQMVMAFIQMFFYQRDMALARAEIVGANLRADDALRNNLHVVQQLQSEVTARTAANDANFQLRNEIAAMQRQQQSRNFFVPAPPASPSLSADAQERLRKRNRPADWDSPDQQRAVLPRTEAYPVASSRLFRMPRSASVENTAAFDPTTSRGSDMGPR